MIKASIRIVHDRKNETKGNRDIPALLQIEVRQLKTSKRVFISTNYKLTKNQFSYSNGIFNCFNHFQSDIITLNVRNQLTEIASFINTERCRTLEDVKNYDKEDSEFGEVIPFIEQELRYRPLTYGTMKHHMTVIRKLKEFGKIKTFGECTYANIDAFDKFIKKQGQSDITTYKKHSILRSYLKEAIKKGLLTANPYDRFEVKKGRIKEPIYLTGEEIDKIKAWVPINDKLSNVKDLFIFQSLTGMSYSDMDSFDKSKITKEGDYDVIRSNRTKTHERFVNILLPEAKEILKKHDYKLPVISNQKYNDYLKVITAHCGISKRVTSHVARHTYAVYLLNNGVPIEVVSVAMGHSNIKMTQHYAKLLAKSTINTLAEKLLSKGLGI